MKGGTHSDFVKFVLELLVFLPKPLDVLQGNLNCLLVCSSYRNHLLLLVPRRGGLMRQISIQTTNMSNQEKIGGSRTHHAISGMHAVWRRTR